MILDKRKSDDFFSDYYLISWELFILEPFFPIPQKLEAFMVFSPPSSKKRSSPGVVVISMTEDDPQFLSMFPKTEPWPSCP
jgi:hypothetical protein